MKIEMQAVSPEKVRDSSPIVLSFSENVQAPGSAYCAPVAPRVKLVTLDEIRRQLFPNLKRAG